MDESYLIAQDAAARERDTCHEDVIKALIGADAEAGSAEERWAAEKDAMDRRYKRGAYKPAKRQKPEAAVQKACRTYLGKLGFLTLRTNNGAWKDISGYYISGAGAKGCSDLTCLAPGGHFLAVEIKAPGEEPTDDQEAYLARVEAMGGLALWADSKAMLREKLIGALGLGLVTDLEYIARTK